MAATLLKQLGEVWQ